QAGEIDAEAERLLDQVEPHALHGAEVAHHLALAGRLDQREPELEAGGERVARGIALPEAHVERARRIAHRRVGPERERLEELLARRPRLSGRYRPRLLQRAPRFARLAGAVELRALRPELLRAGLRLLGFLARRDHAGKARDDHDRAGRREAQRLAGLGDGGAGEQQRGCERGGLISEFHAASPGSDIKDREVYRTHEIPAPRLANRSAFRLRTRRRSARPPAIASPTTRSRHPAPLIAAPP